MTAAELLRTLNDLGVRLSVEGDRIRVDAPSRVVISDLRAALIENKREVRALLLARAANALLTKNQLGPMRVRSFSVKGPEPPPRYEPPRRDVLLGNRGLLSLAEEFEAGVR